MTYRHSWLRKKTAAAPAVDAGAVFLQLMNRQLTNPDTRSHAEFLRDMRAKQAAGGLNPATAELLDRLEKNIPMQHQARGLR